MSFKNPADSPLKAWVRALELTAPIARNPHVTLPARLDELAAAYGAAPALAGERGSLTYAELANLANRYSRWALDQRLRRGDVVGLVMQNCPEYFAIWLGITRTGAIVSLINTNLLGDSLLHAIRVAMPVHVIAGPDLAASVAKACALLEPKPPLWVYGRDLPGAERIDRVIVQLSGAPVSPNESPLPSIADRALYIYTSG